MFFSVAAQVFDPNIMITNNSLRKLGNELYFLKEIWFDNFLLQFHNP